MTDVVNLNRFRKDRQRDQEKKEAAVNRSRFGRTKAERQKEDAEKKRRDELLDGNKIDP